MIGLLRQEVRLLLASAPSVALFIALALLTATAVQFGIARVAETRLAQGTAVQEAQAEWRNKRETFVRVSQGREAVGQYRDPRRADHVVLGYEQALVMQPPPLAILSAGSAREGHGILQVGMRSLRRAGAATRENPANRLDGPLDVAFVTAWLLPLVLILLAHDVLARDRETGTASLLASQRVSLRRIVTARLFVRFVIAFVIVGGLVSAGVLWSSRSLPIRGVALDLGLWLFALAAFVAFWMALAAAVNARARSAAGAALALLGGWLGIALLVPALATAAIDSSAPAPDRLASVLGMRALDSRLTEDAGAVTEAYYRANPSRRPVRPAFDEYEAYFVGQYYPRQVTLDAIHLPQLRRSEDAAVARAAALRRWAMVSPPLAMAMLSEDLAGHAPERRRWFARSARAFQDRWRDVFDVALASRSPLTLKHYDRAPMAAAPGEPGAARRMLSVNGLVSLLAAALLLITYAGRRLASARP